MTILARERHSIRRENAVPLDLQLCRSPCVPRYSFGGAAAGIAPTHLFL